MRITLELVLSVTHRAEIHHIACAIPLAAAGIGREIIRLILADSDFFCRRHRLTACENECAAHFS